MQNREIFSILLLMAILLGGLWSAGCISPDIPGMMSSQKASSEGMGMDHWNAPIAAYPTPAPAPGAGAWAGDDQKIIRTARVDLEVKDVMATRDALQSIATANEGYIGSLSIDRYRGDRLSGSLVMRVPAASFERALASIAALGRLQSQAVRADDVTEEYVDLQARRMALANQRAQYQRIMERAGNVSEILEVQQQIERVQVEIDRIDGRLKYLDNRIDYATITVSFREPEPVGAGGGPSVTSVINEGIAGFLGVTAALVIILISIIPLVVLALVACAAYRWWKGRKGAQAEEKRPE
ncbi:MAG TPA: DUF4349 domain-containing protein [Methanolinea sp.]|nr:DUF4349 domain-containing protein [Methanolinea sp.]